MNIADADVEHFLRLLTFLPLEQVSAVVEAHRTAKERRRAQRLLAREVTELVHGREAAQEAERRTAVLHSAEVRSRAHAMGREEFEHYF